jgi:hypothetical protein
MCASTLASCGETATFFSVDWKERFPAVIGRPNPDVVVVANVPLV